MSAYDIRKIAVPPYFSRINSAAEKIKIMAANGWRRKILADFRRVQNFQKFKIGYSEIQVFDPISEYLCPNIYI